MREAAHPSVPRSLGRGGAVGVLWRFGRPHTVIGTSVGIAAIYCIAVAGPLLVDDANGPLLAITHLAAAVLLVAWARRLDLGDRLAFAAFYQRVWRLFFAEYAVMAIAVLIGP